MKRLYLLIAPVFVAAAGYSQTLINFGTNAISKDDFLRAYNKNKTQVADKEKSIRDYVELYTNFKLKVKEAQLAKMDTSEQFRNDLANFRQQIEENYLSDEQTFKGLMDEAFRRSQSDLHVIRYSIPITDKDEPADTLKKFSAIQDVYEKLKKNTPGEEIVSATGARMVDMGFITVFTLPYAYENLVYSLKPGECSKPYRAKKAWHVFKVVEQRASAGKWRIAQILFTMPDDADPATRNKIKNTADSVYLLLQNGAEFATMARIFSDDKLTYLNAGELPAFGTGKYDMAFESEVLKLKKDNDFSAPFSTNFGIHIIKRLEHVPMPVSKDDDALQFELKQKIQQDDRVKSAKDKFAGDIAGKIGFKPSPLVSQADLLRYADSVMERVDDPEYASHAPISSKVIITFNKGSLKGEDWLVFARDFKSNPELYKGESNAEIWRKYKNVSSLDYYRKHLEEFNPDFAYQLKEFREGNLLFEIMEKRVWSKASADSNGLQNYYESNKKQYLWAESADVLIVNAVNEQLANETLDKIRRGQSWKSLVDARPGELQGDSGRFELTQINGSSSALPGSFSSVTRNADGTSTFIRYFKMYPAGDQRNFEDSKGMVINDYQNVVEKKWIQDLRKKYPVKVNEVLLKQVISEAK